MQTDSPMVPLNTLNAGDSFVIAGDSAHTVFEKSDRDDPNDSARVLCLRLATGVLDSRGKTEGVIKVPYKAVLA